MLLRAGCSITEACLRSAECNELGATIAHNLVNGARLTDALQPLREGSDAVGNTLATILVQASLDGLPVLTTIHQLSMETRTEQRRLVECRVQELPVRLTFPTVFFILPSFFLLAVAPFVVSQLHKMSLPFSPAT
ncbi:MAG: putative type secretion system protein [Actinomycetota bacterium]